MIDATLHPSPLIVSTFCSERIRPPRPLTEHVHKLHSARLTSQEVFDRDNTGGEAYERPPPALDAAIKASDTLAGGTQLAKLRGWNV